MKGTGWVAAGLSLALALTNALPVTAQGGGRLPQAIPSQRSPVAVENLRLRVGLGDFVIRRGILVPGSEIGGRVAEFAFVGEATLEIDPPDRIEEHQLRLFTGKDRVRENVTEGVLVVALDAAAEAILSRPAASLDGGQQQRTAEILDRWQSSSERRLLDIDSALVADAAEDPVAEGFFAGWLLGESYGRFLYLVSPRDREQVTLGRFERIEATERERRKAQRQIHKQQRRGRLVGLEVDDLGQFDTWLSASLRSNGRTTPGDPGFEPEHYALDVTLTGRRLDLSASATIDLVANAGAGRVVPLSLPSELRVSSAAVGTAAGPLEEAAFHQGFSEVLLVLPEVAKPGQQLRVRLNYEGVAVSAEGRSFSLIDTLGWYPHVGLLDLATYEARFTWPRRLELLAPGAVVEAGVEGSNSWQERRLETPSKGYTFEIGDFERAQARFGDTLVELAIDREARQLVNEPKALLQHFGDALLYLEAQYGPLGLDTIQVVTTPRPFSQAMLGFVTMSTFMVIDDAILAQLGWEDPRTVIAHELAHQWWGHRISWASSRDQWLSEALANWSARLYREERLGGELSFWAGPTDGWAGRLAAKDASGHPVGLRGPVVLGGRLSSSVSSDAYQTIVYRKGAVVLQTLARMMGEDAFRQILRWQQDNLAGQTLSTEQFITYLEQGSGLDLGAAARQLVYGTGQTRIDFRTQTERSDDGVELRLSMTKQPASYYQYELLRTERGSYDVRRRVHTDEPADYPAVAPLVISSSAGPRPGRRRAGDPLPLLKRRGFIRLEGGEPVALTLPAAPELVELDPNQEIFARFYDRTRRDKPTLFLEALQRRDRGDDEGASALLAALREAPSRPGDPRSDAAYAVLALIEQARLEMDAGGNAEETIARARKEVKRTDSWERDAYRGEIDIAEARHHLIAGRASESLGLLRKSYRQGFLEEDAEALLLLAAAANLNGDEELGAELASKIERRIGDALGHELLEGGG
ncbi:MAG: M1 family aminopeptidase [Acidobacteriota bacterium]